jgi:hypothetical protein
MSNLRMSGALPPLSYEFSWCDGELNTRKTLPLHLPSSKETNVQTNFIVLEKMGKHTHTNIYIHKKFWEEVIAYFFDKTRTA